MTNEKIVNLCHRFDNTKPAFSKIISAHLRMVDPVELAVEFEVAISTVWAWSELMAVKPHPLLQVQIVRWIAARACGEPVIVVS